MDTITRNLIDIFGPLRLDNSFSSTEKLIINKYTKYKAMATTGHTDKADRKHARISPSKLKQVVGCLGSFALLELNPHLNINTKSKAADSGTKTGEMVEAMLNYYFDERFQYKKIDPNASVPALFTKANIGTDTEQEFKDRIDRCKDILNHLKFWREDLVKLYGEKLEFIFFGQEVYLESWDLDSTEKVCGHADILIAYRINGAIYPVVMDVKDGQHIVEATSPQLTAYAGGFVKHLVNIGLATYDSFHTVEFRILQPSRDNFDYRFLMWPDFLEEVKKLKEGTLTAYSLKDKPLEVIQSQLKATDENCLWCKAKSVCVEFQNKAGAVFEPILDEAPVVIVPKKALATLTETQKVNLVVNFKLLEELRDLVKADLKERWLAGEKIPGTKLVKGKPDTTEWLGSVDIEERRKALIEIGAEPTEVKDKSPAKIKKEIGEAKFKVLIENKLTEKKGYGLTVAGTKDRRKELTEKEIQDLRDKDTPEFEAIED